VIRNECVSFAGRFVPRKGTWPQRRRLLMTSCRVSTTLSQAHRRFVVWSLLCALLVAARASNNTLALLLRLLSMSTRSLQRTATTTQRWTRRLR
jgi:hypothetical protein